MNPFEIFGLAPAFRVDAAALDARFRELSKVVHPDRHARGGPAERRAALSRAIDVNAAYRVLRDPVKRGEALLALHGRAPEDGGKASPALLLEMMELREALAEARARADLERVQAQRDAISSRRDAVLERVGSALDTGDVEAAIVALGEARYLGRYLDEVRLTEEDLGDRAS